MASVQFYGGGYGLSINSLNNSGLGFFGTSFGQSVSVGAWQQSTWITDGNGINQGPQVNNITYVHPNSGTVQNGTNVNLQNIPNYQSTLNIHFNNSTPVRTQNAKLYIYDRVSTSNPPSSVICYCANIVHPDTVQNANGSGNLSWVNVAGTGYLPMSTLSNGNTYSPGLSGQSPAGGATSDMNHDWYVALSCSPTTVGGKLFGLLFSTEYL